MHTNSFYPHLFTPLRIGEVVLPNRIIMGSMHTGLEEKKDGFKCLADYFAARAKGGAGLIVTGGISPNRRGWLVPFGAKLSTKREAAQHRTITHAVHEHGSRICLQILHGGRYSLHPLSVAPSAVKSPISPFRPFEMSARLIQRTIEDYGTTAALAMEAGYDGIEIMGSEGYLINQFVAPRTNRRQDDWGGTFENRIRFPLQILKTCRQRTSKNFIIIFRVSMLDLVEQGSTWEEVEMLAKAVELAGASIINTGIGWHEAKVPTIASMVPRGGYAWVTKRLMGKLNIPLVATNRINTPEIAEEILRDRNADLISMARPFLADPDFVVKASKGHGQLINTCIACNQACLDHVFERKNASCLVNPRACKETAIPKPTFHTKNMEKRVAIVGGGPAGLSCALELSQLGCEVHLFEATESLGGQFNLAKRIPGKEDFAETIRYFREMMAFHGVNVMLNTFATPQTLMDGSFTDIVLATGITPRIPDIKGINHPKVCTYVDLLTGKVLPGNSVAIIGAGGIGFDVATFLSHQPLEKNTVDHYFNTWGVDPTYQYRGGLTNPSPVFLNRQLFLLQRSKGKLGATLGKTTGWAHRMYLKNQGVEMIPQAEYCLIDDEGLHINSNGIPRILQVDSIVNCTGQKSNSILFNELKSKHPKLHLIGGAKDALALDAKRAIEEGLICAQRIHKSNPTKI
jgi:2,4-dienoyl-CoA reductase (NADPH2)